MPTPTERNMPAALTAEQKSINRRLLEAVGFRSVECCHICEQPKVRRGVPGDDVYLGWPACGNPDCMCYGDAVASAAFRLRGPNMEMPPNLFCTTPDAAGYEATYWREAVKLHLLAQGFHFVETFSFGKFVIRYLHWQYTEKDGECRLGRTYAEAFLLAADAALTVLQASAADGAKDAG